MFSSLLLHSCKSLKTLKQIHASIIVSTGYIEPISFASKIVSLYSNFNDLECAISICKTLQEPSTLRWNLIIKSHVDVGLCGQALVFFKKMRELGTKVDSFTFPIINRAVLLLNSDVLYQQMFHCVALKLGFGFDLYFCNTMIDVYAKSGFVGSARKMFEEMLQRDLISWTTMISGYVVEGNVSRAFELLNEMRTEMDPNSVTIIVMLQGCCASGSFVEGRQLHCYVIKNGLLVDGSVQNSMLRMYSKMGPIEEVERLFIEIDKRDVVSWNTLINFYSIRGDVEKVAYSFNQMQKDEVVFSSETLTLVVSFFAQSGNTWDGQKLHCFSFKVALCDDVLLTSLLDFYAKCGEVRNSAKLFTEICCRSSITWNAMMSGFIQNGWFDEAVDLFRRMQTSDLELGAGILGSLVDACTHLGALQLGKGIHGYLIRNFYFPEEDDMRLWTSILNMYVRCGSISLARECFNRMLVKDIVTWTSMIEGYGIHGQGIEVINLFHRMLEEGITPNSVTILSLLSGCSHSGLVVEACQLFFSMKWIFGIEPDLDHYTCMVDLLGRYGKLKEALTIILKMVVSPDKSIWGALLGASRVHGDKRVGEYAAQKVLEMEPDNVGCYTLLSNIKASVGQWHEVEEVRRVMHEKDLKKTPGWSYIEEKGKNCYFVQGDRSHKQAEEIYEVLEHLSRKVQEFGYA